MTGNLETFNQSMNLGHSAAWDQKWGQAAEYYRQALDEFPDQPNALTSLGLALFEMREFDQALQMYIRAARALPTDPVPLEKIGRIYEILKKTPEAVQVYARLGDLLLQVHDTEKSIETWRRLLSMQPDHLTGRTRLGIIYERTGRKGEAALEFLAVSSILQQTGQSAKALQTLAHAVELDPENLDLQQALQNIKNGKPLAAPQRVRGFTAPLTAVGTDHQLTGSKDPESNLDPIAEGRKKALEGLAQVLFNQAEQSQDDTPAANRRGIASFSRGERGRQTDRTRIMLHLSQVIDSQSQGQDAQAAEELERAVDAGLDHPAAAFDLGLLLNQKDPQRSLRHLQKAVLSNDYALASYLLMGDLQEKAQDFQSAATSYLQALRLADAATTTPAAAEEILALYESIIEAQLSQKDMDELKKICAGIRGHLIRPNWRSYLKNARQQIPGGPDAAPLPLAETLLETSSGQAVDSLTLVRRLTAENKLRSAMDEAFNALQESPTYLPLHIQIGEILLQEGRVQDAVQKFLLVADLYSLRGEAHQAIRLLNRVVQIAPLDLKVRSKLIELLTAQGKTDDAIQQHMQMANTYYQLAELDSARQAYYAALRLAQTAHTEESWSVAILYKVADIDVQRLDWRQAIRVLEQIRTIEPEEINARMQIVDLNFRLGQDSAALSEVDQFTSMMDNSGKRKVSIEFVIGVLNERAENLDLRKRLAEIYARDRQIPQAVVQLEKIADAMKAAGNKRGAAAMLQTIIALKPANVEHYQQALNQLMTQP